MAYNSTMSHQVLNPIAAFDVENGVPKEITEPWPAAHTLSGYRWLHLDLSDDTTTLWVKAHLPEIAAAALCQSETRPRCERLEDGLILNLRGINLNPEAAPEDMVSLRMWIEGRTIVTARLRKVWAVEALRDSVAAGKPPQSVGRVLVELTQGLTNRIETVSLELEDQTDEFEVLALDRQFVAPENLGRTRQAVIKMRRFINPQREAVSALAALEDWILHEDDLAALRENANRTRRIVEELDATRDRLSAVQDQVDALRASALSRNSYILSVVAAIFLPLGFITGLFGVNVAGMPGTESSSAFWMLTGVSSATGIALFFIFKFAKWL